MKIKKVIFCIIILLIFNSIFSLKYEYKDTILGKKLANISTKSIFQDKDGFMIIISNHKIIKYNGLSYIEIQDKFFNEEKKILKGFTDKNNNFWFLTADKIYIFDSNYILKKEFKYDFHNKYSLMHNYLVSDKGVWIANKNRLFYYDDDFQEIKLGKDFRDYKIINLGQYKDNILISTDKGIFKLDKNNKVSLLDERYQNLSTAIKIDSKGFLYFFDNKNIIKYNLSNKKATEIESEHKIKYILNICEDKAGSIWFASYSDIFVLENDKLNKVNDFQNTKINTIYNDTENNIWLGRLHTGLAKIQKNIFNFYNSEHKLSFNNINSIIKDKNENIWLFSQFNNTIFVQDNDENFTQVHIPKHIIPLSLHSLNNEIFLCDLKKNVYIFRDNNWEKIFSEISFDSLIINMFQDSEDNYLINTVNTIYKFSKTKKLIYKKKDKFTQRISTIYQDQNSVLWFGTKNKGIYSLFNKKWHLHYFDDLKSQSVTGITTFKDKFFIATDKGLYEVVDNKLHFIENNFLADRGIKSLLIHNNQLLIGTTDGILVYNGKTFYPLLTEKLEKSFYINRSTSLDDKEYLWFGSSNGAIRLNSADIVQKVKKTSLYFNNLQVNNQKMLIDNSMKLNHKQNTIRMSYGVINFSFPKETIYKYRLLGNNNDWIFTKNNFVQFSFLPPGDYNFEIKAKTYNNLWSETENINFEILPIWWKTKTAFFSFLFLFLFSSFLLYRIKIRQQEKKISRKKNELKRQKELSDELIIANEKLKNIDKFKNNFLNQVSHQIRTPLNGILGITRLIKDGNFGKLNKNVQSNIEILFRSSQRLSYFVNDLLDYGKFMENDFSLNKSTQINLNPMFKMILRLTQTIYRKDIEINNRIDSEIPYVVGDENRIFQIIYNILDNSYKYMNKGKINLSYEIINNSVKISIEDNGNGIPQKIVNFITNNDLKSSFSIINSALFGLTMPLTKALVEAQDGKFDIKNLSSSGTEVNFSLPLSKVPKMRRDSTFDNLDTLNFSSQTSSSNKDKKNILIIEDDYVNAQIIKSYLQDDFEITTSCDLDEVFSIINSKKCPNLILLDIILSDISGFEICKRIRKNYSISQLPIIFMSIKNDLIDIEKGFSLGGNDHITKPIRKNELLSRISTHLNISENFKTYTKFIPIDFFKFLKIDSLNEIKLGNAINKDLNILVADIRSFTKINSDKTPEESFKLINSILKEIGPIVRNNGGFIDNYIGDAILAIFKTGDNSALKTAIDIQSALEKFNKNREEKIDMGISLNQGEAMIGTIGEEERMDNTIISADVNKTFKLEAKNKDLGTLILATEKFINNSKKLRYFRFVGNLEGKMFEIYQPSKDRDLILSYNDRFEKAVLTFLEKEFEIALSKFTELIEINPRDEIVSNYLKKCEISLKKKEDIKYLP